LALLSRQATVDSASDGTRRFGRRQASAGDAEEHVLTGDFDGSGRLTDEDVRWLDQRMAGFGNDLSVELQTVLAERLDVGPEDGLTLASGLVRLMVLHELRKTGVLSYDEFRGLKSRLLGL
jgi:hypothetical protein